MNKLISFVSHLIVKRYSFNLYYDKSGNIRIDIPNFSGNFIELSKLELDSMTYGELVEYVNDKYYE